VCFENQRNDNTKAVSGPYSRSVSGVRLRLTRAAAAGRRGRLVAALIVFACACACIVQMPGWAQTSYISLTRALDSGTAQVDRWHWQTHDIAWYDGHYYSVKAPGLPLATLPLYAGMKELGAENLARRARLRAEATGRAPWTQSRPPVEDYGYDLQRTIAARAAIVRCRS